MGLNGSNTQIFICYRCNSGLFMAKNLADYLRKKGYKVYYGDNNSTYAEICMMIELCNDFIVILNENALNFCVDLNDKMRSEILYAYKLRKNIILAQDQVKFSQYPSLPTELEFLRYLNWTPINPQLFDASMSVLIGRMVTPSPQAIVWQWFKRLKWVFLLLIGIVLVLMAYIYWPIPLKEVEDEDKEIVISVPAEWAAVTQHLDSKDWPESLTLLLSYMGSDCGITVTVSDFSEEEVKVMGALSDEAFIKLLKASVTSNGGQFIKTEVKEMFHKKMYVTDYMLNTFVYNTISFRGRELDDIYYYDIAIYYLSKMNMIERNRLLNTFDKMVGSFKELN